ncbi:MAG TPA: hypothetical protein VH418_02050 [Solirubrobacteraceae bacterium]
MTGSTDLPPLGAWAPRGPGEHDASGAGLAERARRHARAGRVREAERLGDAARWHAARAQEQRDAGARFRR